MKKPQSCSECGAELRLGPARCPLCGTEAPVPKLEVAPEEVVDDYQSNVRALRDELRNLRNDDAAAV
ncbi:MAG TPA: hypothetical protein VNC78_09115 [Actinomycetota bacterium]|nr:hypothetical protein [Actinomycetota bacterium]